ncbi:MAG: hypothetical protein JRJ18_18160, partial [Deltaproteobacteria bacterium]|nr:hypothetical protein [Deltaproteobacteria bacterium]
MKTTKVRSFLVCFGVALVMGTTAPLAMADEEPDTSWTGGTDEWDADDPVNWSSGIPGDDDNAAISNGGTATISGTGGDLVAGSLWLGASDDEALEGHVDHCGQRDLLVTDNLFLGKDFESDEVHNGSDGTLEISAGGVEVGSGGTGDLQVYGYGGWHHVIPPEEEGQEEQYYWTPALGTVIQTAGAVTVHGDLLVKAKGGEASYTIDHETAELNVNGSGESWIQISTDTEFDELLGLTSSAVLHLAQGEVTASNVVIGPSSHGGLLRQLGGEMHISGELLVGDLSSGDARYMMISGTMEAGEITMEGGEFQQSGGDVTVSGTVGMAIGTGTTPTGRDASWEMTGGSLQANEIIMGEYGDATFTQSGTSPSVTVTGTLVVGNNVGSAETATYSIAAGTLSAGKLFVGRHPTTGAFIQSGGTVAIGEMVLGDGPASSTTPDEATYTLTGGQLTVTGTAWLANNIVTATFTQSGTAEASFGGDVLLASSEMEEETAEYSLSGDSAACI